jgi:hypothetical protein
MYPVGWCDLVAHKLEGPRTPSTKALAAAGEFIITVLTIYVSDVQIKVTSFC